MSDVDNAESDTDTKDRQDGEESEEDESALQDLITAVTGGDDSSGNDSSLDELAASESRKLLECSRVSASREVIVITPPVPPSHYQYASGRAAQKVRRPSSKALDKNKEKLIEFETKTSPRTIKIICGFITIIIILGIGICMVVLARALAMEDLYIIGIMFIVGGSLFALGFLYVRCVYDKQSNIYDNPVVSYSK